MSKKNSSRKISISFLGVSGYRNTDYIFEEQDGKQVYSTPLVQLAVQRYLQAEYGFGEEDRHILLLTDKAKEENYLSAKIPHNHDKAHHRGLKTELEEAQLLTNTEPKAIDFDHSQSGLFSIFDTISDQVGEEDEVYIDITHGFRSLPMLVVVLSNFLRVTKKATIRKIFYGAFEDRFKFDGKTPIYDLSYLVDMENWSSAAYSYVNYGFIEPLVKLSRSETKPLLKESKGQHEAAQQVRKIVEASKDLALQLRTNRGNDLFLGSTSTAMQEIAADIDDYTSGFSSPLAQLLKVISKKPQRLKANGKLNWLIAARLAFDDNLIQQTVSLLREGMVSYICRNNGLDPGIEQQRKYVESGLNIIAQSIPRAKWNTNEAGKKQIDKILTSPSLSTLQNDFSKLTPLRNDLMHAGYLTETSKKAKDAKRIIIDIKKILESVETTLLTNL